MSWREPGLTAVVLLALPAVTAAALFMTTATALPPGDAERGREIYERCQACHSLERNRTGPKHCGLLGRPAASLPGYRYSKALSESGIVWNEASLDRFLAAPFDAVPGTRMGYAGVKDPQERADLIAFLAAAGPCAE